MTLVTAGDCFALSGAARADDSLRTTKLGRKIANIAFVGVARLPAENATDGDIRPAGELTIFAWIASS
jgi:hypothetical protein